MSNEPVILTEQQIEQIADRAAKKILVSIGIDPSRPMDYQQDMQFLRRWRMSSSSIGSKVVGSMAGLLLAGIVGLIILGIKSWLTGK